MYARIKGRMLIQVDVYQQKKHLWSAPKVRQKAKKKKPKGKKEKLIEQLNRAQRHQESNGTIENRSNFELAIHRKRKPREYLKHASANPRLSRQAHPLVDQIFLNKIFPKTFNSKAIVSVEDKENQ